MGSAQLGVIRRYSKWKREEESSRRTPGGFLIRRDVVVGIRRLEILKSPDSFWMERAASVWPLLEKARSHFTAEP